MQDGTPNGLRRPQSPPTFFARRNCLGKGLCTLPTGGTGAARTGLAVVIWARAKQVGLGQSCCGQADGAEPEQGVGGCCFSAERRLAGALRVRVRRYGKAGVSPDRRPAAALLSAFWGSREAQRLAADNRKEQECFVHPIYICCTKRLDRARKV